MDTPQNLISNPASVFSQMISTLRKMQKRQTLLPYGDKKKRI
jgi:hypothetical protein